MIRPDDITFVPHADGSGVITRRYFRGSETLYCIRLPSGHRVHSSQPSVVGPAHRHARARAGARPARGDLPRRGRGADLGARDRESRPGAGVAPGARAGGRAPRALHRRPAGLRAGRALPAPPSARAPSPGAGARRSSPSPPRAGGRSCAARAPARPREPGPPASARAASRPTPAGRAGGPAPAPARPRARASRKHASPRSASRRSERCPSPASSSGASSAPGARRAAACATHPVRAASERMSWRLCSKTRGSSPGCLRRRYSKYDGGDQRAG